MAVVVRRRHAVERPSASGDISGDPHEDHVDVEEWERRRALTFRLVFFFPIGL